MKPHVIDTIIDSSGNRFTQNPEVVERVVSPETAETLTKMLVSVVRSGFENRAGVKGYFVAGKTGTAQIPRSDARGYTDEVIHTFVGYAPADKPKVAIVMFIEHGGHGGVAAASVANSALTWLKEAGYFT